MNKKLKISIIGSALFVLFITPGIALAQGSDPTTVAETTGDVATLLLPLVAAATAIERIIEMIFNWYESIVLNAGRLVGQSSGYLKWAQDELNEARAAFGKAENATALEMAEVKLLQAEERLQEYLKSPFYLSKKKYLTLLLGLGLGIVIAFMTQLQMLKLMGVSLGTTLAGVDMLVTGLIIGTGSAPVHSIIGLLQNTKDAVYEARSLWRGKSVQALGLRDTYADLMALQMRQSAIESASAPSTPLPSMSGPMDLDAEESAGETEAVAKSLQPQPLIPEDIEYELLKKRRVVQSYLR